MSINLKRVFFCNCLNSVDNIIQNVECNAKYNNSQIHGQSISQSEVIILKKN